MRCIFFGSTDDSVIVLNKLHALFPVTAVVTQPAKPQGRDQVQTKTPVEIWATQEHIPCLSFTQQKDHVWNYEDEHALVNTLSSFKPDLFVTACYGQKLPKEALNLPRYGGLNIHPSLLPRWRGADPVPWTILAGDAQTGVTISTLTDTFDRGAIISQKKISVEHTISSDTLRTQLFTLGGTLLTTILPEYIKGSITQVPQKEEDAVVARKITREDGYIPWNLIILAQQGKDAPKNMRSGLVEVIQQPLPQAIATLSRALFPWPGIWTTIVYNGQTLRVKLFDMSIKNNELHIGSVQREGKTRSDWDTFSRAYLSEK